MSQKLLSVWMLLIAVCSQQALSNELNMPAGVTAISKTVYQLHMTIFIICAVIAAIVFGLMFYCIIKFRKTDGRKAADFHSSLKLEIIWSVIPLLILVAMAVPASQTLMAMHDTSKSELTIKITGSQWKWHYDYLGHDLAFLSQLTTPDAQIRNKQAKDSDYLTQVDRPLVLPTNTKIRFLFTSDDVIHSWWLPDFAVKKDAIPGFINEAWTKIEQSGTYFGQCTELCGTYHAFMPIVVKAVNSNEFDQWLIQQKQQQLQQLDAQRQALEDTMTTMQLMQLGEKVYNKACAVCHQGDGAGLAGIFPAITQSPISLGDIKAHIDIVVNGKEGTAMQSFVNQLNASEIAAVITYERNALGNAVGDQLQASDIQKFIEGQQ